MGQIVSSLVQFRRPDPFFAKARAVHDEEDAEGHPTLEATEMSVLPTPPFATWTVLP
jgi:hypothetical protein